jgi:hypothetical protein
VAGGALAVDSHARELKFFVRKPPASDVEVEVAAGANKADKGRSSPEADDNASGGSGEGGHNRRAFIDERVFLHPSSVNFAQGSFAVPWLGFGEVVRTSRNFVR